MNMEQTVQQCVDWCKGPRRPHIVVTVNAAILVAMRRQASLGQACRSADLIVADGVPVVWASKLAGTPLADRVAGVDLMQQLLDVGSKNELSVYFLGAKQCVVDKLVRICADRYPGVTIAGARNGYFRDDEHAKVVSEIRESGADVLFVGMPTPFKEEWCHQYKEQLGVPVQIGVGGSFDVLAGFVSRAPVYLQTLGMEWSWRLMMEPRKLWRRYLISNTAFVWLTMRTVLSNRLSASEMNH